MWGAAGPGPTPPPAPRQLFGKTAARVKGRGGVGTTVNCTLTCFARAIPAPHPASLRARRSPARQPIGTRRRSLPGRRPRAHPRARRGNQQLFHALPAQTAGPPPRVDVQGRSCIAPSPRAGTPQHTRQACPAACAQKNNGDGQLAARPPRCRARSRGRQPPADPSHLHNLPGRSTSTHTLNSTAKTQAQTTVCCSAGCSRRRNRLQRARRTLKHIEPRMQQCARDRSASVMAYSCSLPMAATQLRAASRAAASLHVSPTQRAADPARWLLRPAKARLACARRPRRCCAGRCAPGAPEPRVHLHGRAAPACSGRRRGQNCGRGARALRCARGPARQGRAGRGCRGGRAQNPSKP